MIVLFTVWGYDVTALELASVITRLHRHRPEHPRKPAGRPFCFCQTCCTAGSSWVFICSPGLDAADLHAAAAIWGWFSWGREGVRVPMRLSLPQRGGRRPAVLALWALLAPLLPESISGRPPGATLSCSPGRWPAVADGSTGTGRWMAVNTVGTGGSMPARASTSPRCSTRCSFSRPSRAGGHGRARRNSGPGVAGVGPVPSPLRAGDLVWRGVDRQVDIGRHARGRLRRSSSREFLRTWVPSAMGVPGPPEQPVMAAHRAGSCRHQKQADRTG